MTHKCRRLLVEGLEPRAMFSADLQNGLLTIVGTNKSDTITAILDSPNSQLDVSVNGQHSFFPVANVDQILVMGKNGNDTITIAADVLIDASIYGGNGNDTLTGGGGNDVVLGGNAKDKLFGGEGDDTLYGGNGNDRLDGGEGDDLLDGGNGKDICQGAQGDDRLRGGRDNDVVDGGPGNNLLDIGGKKDKRRNGQSTRLDNQFNTY